MLSQQINRSVYAQRQISPNNRPSVSLGVTSTPNPTVAAMVLDKVPMVLDVPHLGETVVRWRIGLDRRGRAVIACVRMAGKRGAAVLRLRKRGKCQDKCGNSK